jgi:hypothetical protein
MFLSTNIGLGVIRSPMSISSKGSVDEKHCPNLSTSPKSSMASRNEQAPEAPAQNRENRTLWFDKPDYPVLSILMIVMGTASTQ